MGCRLSKWLSDFLQKKLLQFSISEALLVFAKSLATVFFFVSHAQANEFDGAYLADRYGRKVLFLDSEIVSAIEATKLEASKQKVSMDTIVRYTIAFDKEKIAVSLLPPYEGGLDGPEFRVEFSRPELKVLEIVNKFQK